MTEFLGLNLASSHLFYIFHKYSCQYNEYSVYDLEYVLTVSRVFKNILMHYYYVCDYNLIKINIISYSFICFQHYIFINLFNATNIPVYSTCMLSNILWRNVMSTHTVEKINYLLCVLFKLLWQHGQRLKKTLQQPGFLSAVLKWSQKHAEKENFLKQIPVNLHSMP